jgi:carboxyl-terminal processing protease
MMGNKKLQVWLPLIFSLILIVGMFLGYQLRREGAQKGFFASNKRTTLEEAMDIIRFKYVDSVNTDSLQGKAIQDIMSELDPHSVYLPPADLKEANEDLAGNFEGIGIEFNLFSDTVYVVYVIPGSPGDKAGMQIGDKILKANDSSVSGKGLTTDDIKKMIRGQLGSKATLQLLRNGKQVVVTVTRGTIPVSSVDAAYMIDNTIAYLKLNKFSEHSYQEFMQSMESLQKQGMKDLILDLRHNGGGFMNEAVDMADEFLGGDKLIVYTEGVNNKKREYHCKRPGIFEKGNLVILTDELTASASEVLTGALQDWCRAKVIGRRTFGKGLVMEQFPLKDGSALRLTTARYYTPLGRCIQRSYEKGKKVYMDEVWERYSNGEMFYADSNKTVHGPAYLTMCKDTVYGGEGIMPDIFVPLDTVLYQKEINKALYSSSLSNFAFNYYLQHKKEMEQYSSLKDFVLQFDAASLFQNFSATGQLPKVVTKAVADRIMLQFKAMLARFRWRSAGYYQVLNTDDKELNKALEVIRK